MCGNTTVHITRLSAILCPSDIDRLTTQVSNGSKFGHNNYCFNAGDDAYGNWHPSVWSGPFIPAYDGNKGSQAPVSAASIIDGLSNTAGASERVLGTGTNNNALLDPLKPSSNSFKAAGLNATPTTPAALYAICNAVQQTAGNINSGDPAGGYWTDGNPAQEIYNHVMPPNIWACDVTNNYDNKSGALGTAASRHSGIVNVLMMDGSTRSIKSSINTTTWWAIGTKAFGEVVSADQL